MGATYDVTGSSPEVGWLQATVVITIKANNAKPETRNFNLPIASALPGCSRHVHTSASADHMIKTLLDMPIAPTLEPAVHHASYAVDEQNHNRADARRMGSPGTTSAGMSSLCQII